MNRERIDRAVRAIRRVTSLAPSAGVILGSGLGGGIDVDSDRVEIPYRDIPGWPATGVEGHAGVLILGRLGDTPVALMKGRAHHYEGWPMEDLAFPVRVAAALGVRAIVITAAAGSLRRSLRPGGLVLLADHINFMGESPLRGPDFLSMEGAYDPALRAMARRLARRERLSLKEGVYVATAGPAYETPAEVRMLRTLGGDVVGMSVVPEVMAARQAGLRVLGLARVANLGAGLGGRPLSHAEVLRNAARGQPRMVSFLRRVLIELGRAA